MPPYLRDVLTDSCMELLFTPELLNFLIGKGYTYCLSKTLCTPLLDTSVHIYLLPVHEQPVTEKLPDDYDTWFITTDEPAQMAKGIDDTIVTVQLNAADSGLYIRGLNSSQISATDFSTYQAI